MTSPSEKIKKILDKKVNRKKFLQILGLSAAAIPLLSPSVAAKFFLRQSNGNLIDIDDLDPNASAPAGSEGEIQFKQGTTLGASNNLYWNNTQNRLGIGTNSPDETLHVVGNTEVDGDLGVTGDAGVIGYVRADNGFQVDGTTIIDDSRNIINAGTATFSGTVTAATPSANEHLATKAYVDNTVSGAEFDKGGLVEGDGVSLSGTLTNRLIGQGTLSISTLPASDTQPGHVTTGTQTFAGTKTFNTTPLNISANNQTLNFSSTTGTKTITTGGSTHLNINPGGNVGIGTTDPSEKLEVNGNINVIGTSAYLYAGYNAIRLATKGDASVSFSSTIIGRRAGDSTVDGSTERQTALGYEAGSNNSGERQTAVGYQAGRGNSGERQTALGYIAGYQNSGYDVVAIGYQAGFQNTGIRQTAVGYLAGFQNTGEHQTAVGHQAGRSNTGEHQTALGYIAGRSNTGEHQTAVGYIAGFQNTGERQTALGHQAGRSNTGEHQTALGYLAGRSNTGEHQTTLGYEAGSNNSGEHQTALGYLAGRSNTGEHQTTLGYLAGYQNTGERQTALGYEAGRENSGDDVVAIGYQAGKNNTTNNQFIVQQTNINATPLIQGNFSTGNVGIGTTDPSEKLEVNGNINVIGTSAYLYAGYNAIRLATKGDTSVSFSSTIIGKRAGDSTVDGSTERQTALGYEAGSNNSGERQTALGYEAGSNNSGIHQTAVGYLAGYQNTGERQTALGYLAGRSNTGEHQTTLGYEAGRSNSGERQTALGYLAGFQNTGEHQTAVGYLAGRSNTGEHQTTLGYLAGYQNTGEHQTTLGHQAGRSNTGERQTALGHQAGRSNSGTRQTALGHQAGRSNTGEHQTTLGYLAGYQNTGERQTALGYQAGRENSGDDVVAIGYQAGKNNTTNNQFIVQQTNINATPLIQGNFSTGNVGIGTTDPSEKLEVNGKIRMRDETENGDADDIVVTKGYVDALPKGKILQVVQGSTSTSTSVTSSTYTDSGLSASITPSSTSSKILVLVSHTLAMSGSSSTSQLIYHTRILRDATEIQEKGHIAKTGAGSGPAIDISLDGTMIKLDSPNTTSEITYKTQGKAEYGEVLYFQRLNTESTITLIEIEE